MRIRLVPLSGALVLSVLALGGCGELQPVAPFAPETDATKLYGSLTLDHRAINLSTFPPYDTIRLTATPRNLRGEPLEGLPAATFRSSDTASVWVTPDGLVQARRAATGVQVIAEVVTGDNIRHADTAYVRVISNPAPPEIAHFSIISPSSEQAEWPMDSPTATVTIIPFVLAGLTTPVPFAHSVLTDVRDGAGSPVVGLEIEYVSLDPGKLVVDRRTGEVQGVVGPPGEVNIIARTTAYGVVKADTVSITITPPAGQAFGIEYKGGVQEWRFKEVVIRPGGIVVWIVNFSKIFHPAPSDEVAPPVSITFDDPTDIEADTELCAAFGAAQPYHCESGDMVVVENNDPLSLFGAQARRFPKPGLYRFTTDSGVQGRVRVAAADDPIWDAMRRGQ